MVYIPCYQPGSKAGKDDDDDDVLEDGNIPNCSIFNGKATTIADMSLTATWASLHLTLKEVQVVENGNVHI